MKKILVTGANGYIGARLCKFLSGKGFHVTGLCYPLIPIETAWVEELDECIIGDVRNIELMTSLSDKRFDVIIHLISLDHHQSNADPTYVSSINVVPTWSLLDIFSKKGLGQFIYFSTIQVYGKLKEGVIDETRVPDCINPYGLTHYLSENLCHYFNQNSSTACTVFRLSNSYGSPVFIDNNCWWLVINDLCKSAYINKHIKLLSDGSPQRDFIHGNDLCQAVELLINTEDRNIQKGIYHISFGNTHTILELAGKIKNIYINRYGETIPVSTSAKTEVEDFNIFNKTQGYVIDNSRLRNIGFDPIWSLDKGINELFDYMEKNYGV